MEVKEERPITWTEAKDILEKKEKSRELGYVQQNALDYLRKFTTLKPKEAQDLVTELSGIEKLKDSLIVQIANLLPKNEDELRQLLQHEVVSLSEEEIKNILSIVSKFR
ncbi:MAG: RNA polymerase Rpb4 family protein [Nanoarchaeota archaeon]|nr:RNA polymerase Rpb4 family protein [Nanoarchaeota archaeon]